MERLTRKLVHHPGLVIGGMVVLGVIEFVALQRAQRKHRRRRPDAERKAA